MKKTLITLLALVFALSVFAIPVYAAEELTSFALFDDFDRDDADRDLAGGVNAEGKTVWWTNWDAGTSIEDNALKMTGEAHFGAGIDTGTEWQYLVLIVKGDAEGILVAPAGTAVALDALVDADGNALPALTDEWQEWVIDIEASGLARDPGLHLNTASGTLYVDGIGYASAGEAPAAAPAEEPEAEAPADAAPAEFPDPALVDDFNRAADEADNSGGFNTQGADTWWYNVYDYVIEDGALVADFDGGEKNHFGVGANVAVEAGYKYLVMRVKGVEGGDYSTLMLNLGAKNPVMFAEMVGPSGAALPQIGADWVDLVIDLSASGIVFDQGFHLNSESAGTLYIDEIYYTNTAGETAAAAPAETEDEVAAPAAEQVNPKTGESNFVGIAIIAVLLSGAMLVFLSRKARKQN